MAQYQRGSPNNVAPSSLTLCLAHQHATAGFMVRILITRFNETQEHRLHKTKICESASETSARRLIDSHTACSKNDSRLIAVVVALIRVSSVIGFRRS
jgi:hypothetical protein